MRGLDRIASASSPPYRMILKHGRTPDCADKRPRTQHNIRVGRLAHAPHLWHCASMKYLAAVLALTLSSLPALAEPMSAAEFEAYVTGKTLYYGNDGVAYGAEIYHENRRVTWSFLDGNCKEGYWYEAEPANICFVYEDRTDTQCWTFEKTGRGLRATFTSDPDTTELYEAQDLGEELICLGPKVGV